MSLIQRIKNASKESGVGEGIRKIEPHGSHVRVWENLNEEQIKKLRKSLVSEFGKKSVVVEDTTVILRYQKGL